MSTTRIALVLTLTLNGGSALSPCRCGEPDRPEATRYLKLLDDEDSR